MTIVSELEKPQLKIINFQSKIYGSLMLSWRKQMWIQRGYSIQSDDVR